MIGQAPSRPNLRNVIAAAVWKRVTQDEGSFDDLWPIDREEFEQDADAVLAALTRSGFHIVARPVFEQFRDGALLAAENGLDELAEVLDEMAEQAELEPTA